MAERRRRVAALLLALGLAATGCTKPAPAPPPPASTTAAPRLFTVGTTERIGVLDPAVAVDDLSQALATNLFQRLMTTEPGEQLLKPDAAEDCLFKSETSYVCRLRPNLRFVTGGALTSSDVKFSILRALRLGADGAAVSSLRALDRIETPDDLTVRFELKWPDTQFGFALAAPAFSLVNEDIYAPDSVRAADLMPSGSGPMRWLDTQADGATLGGYGDYVGPHGAQVQPIRFKTFPDSGALEEAIGRGEVDYVWRGLSEAAVKRLTNEAKANNGRTKAGLGPVYLSRTRTTLVRWNPASPARLDGALRTAVAAALQDERTMTSLLPADAPGAIAAYPVGGTPSAPPIVDSRPRLTLTYDDRVPDATQRARELRDQMEARAGISVQLVPGNASADLAIVDRRAWVHAPLAWLEPYTSAPPPGSAAKVAELDQRWRTTTDKTARETALAEIQQQAAADLVVLPIAEEDEVAFLAAGHQLSEPRFGPGFQLALWAIKKG